MKTPQQLLEEMEREERNKKPFDWKEMYEKFDKELEKEFKKKRREK